MDYQKAAKQLAFDETTEHRNYRMYITVLELLDARGYGVDEDKLEMTFEMFEEYQKEGSKESQVFTKVDEEDEKSTQSILVFYNFQKHKITLEFLQKYISNAHDVKNFIFISSAASKTKKTDLDVDKKAIIYASQLKTSSNPIHIEFFKDEELLFNVLKHDLVPQHRVLNSTEKQQLLKQYRIKESQIPKILLSDPVSKFLGLQRGQVVKIFRKSETAGTYSTYRIAV